MAAINVGPAATDRAGIAPYGYTALDLANPANDTGTITTITTFINAGITTLRVGIFYATGGGKYKCRSTVALGVAPAGLNTFTKDSGGTDISLAVVTGDVIGSYYANGYMDRDESGGNSAYANGEYIDVDDEATYTTGARIYSLHGLGATGGAATQFMTGNKYW